MSLGYGHLIVVTATQCFIYNVQNWNTPHIFDLRDITSLLIQAEKHFAIVDNFSGIQIFTYEGRNTSNPRFSGLRPEFLNKQNISLSKDFVAVIDRSDSRLARLFDIATGRALQHPVKHMMEIVELSLCNYGQGSDRKIAIIDRNRDLYVSTVSATSKPDLVKLQTQVDSVCWNDKSDVLAALSDGKLITWYYPSVLYVDRDLLPLTTVVKDGSEFGKIPTILGFFGTRVNVRKADGAQMTASVSPYPAMLYEFVTNKRWEDAVRLCRFVKNDSLWGTLAGTSLLLLPLF
jgi:intraflagellar transport protein 80